MDNKLHKNKFRQHTRKSKKGAHKKNKRNNKQIGPIRPMTNDDKPLTHHKTTANTHETEEKE